MWKSLRGILCKFQDHVRDPFSRQHTIAQPTSVQPTSVLSPNLQPSTMQVSSSKSQGESRKGVEPGSRGVWQCPQEWLIGPSDTSKIGPKYLYAKQPSNLSIPSTDAEDESLQRYKESLGLGKGKDISDPNDKRHCIILSLTMDSEGRDPVTIDLSQEGSAATLKDKPFKIKEGAKFNMTAKFKVQHEVLSGLQYVQIVKRKGIRVSKDQEMIVRDLDLTFE